MYTNAEEILPEELLRQVQEYIQGQEIYIPKLQFQVELPSKIVL